MLSPVKLNVKKGDTVVVLSGKDKGKQGKVIAAMPKKGKVVVEGVNKVKRHTKPNQKAPQGGILVKEAPMHACKGASVSVQMLHRLFTLETEFSTRLSPLPTMPSVAAERKSINPSNTLHTSAAVFSSFTSDTSFGGMQPLKWRLRTS